MAAPTFVGAGAGVTIASGSAACTAAGSGVAVGDLVILQVLQDGTAASAVTYSAISGIANLAGTASSLTVLATDQTCGTLAKQHLRVGRATSTTCSVTVATTGDDLYYRLYVFRDVNSGTALTDILENGTAGTIANGSGATAAVADTGVTTLGVDRLALQFVGVDDDNPLDSFTGTTGGVWTEAVAEFASATGTDAAIQLQLGVVGTTIANWPTPPAVDIAIQGAGFSPAAVAQSFASGAGGTVSQVILQLSAFNAPTDNLIVEIQADAAGQPSGTVIGTAATVPAMGSVDKICVLSVAATLAASTTYWLVLRRSGTPSGSNYFRVVYEPSLVYPGGTASTQDNTGAWVTFLYDLAFVLNYGVAGTINGGSYTMAAADNWGVIGFALKPVPAVAGTNWTQPVADTLSLADSATTQAGKSATIGDTLALADAASSAAVFARTVPDTLAVADVVAFQRDVNQAIPDTLTLADSLAAQRGIAQAVADTLTLADLATTAAGKGVSLADALALADALGSAGVFQRAIADTLSLADTIAAQSAFQLSVADTLTLADALSSQAAFVRALADTLTLADLTDPVKGVGGVDHTQPIADVVALADALTAGSTLARAVADTLALADSLTAQKEILRALADTVSLADALRFGRALGLADALQLVDAVSFQAVYLRTLVDTLSLADSVTASRVLTQAVADLLGLADSLAVTAGRQLALDDALDLADLLTLIQTTPVGGPPLADGHFIFTSRGRITQSATGEYTGRGHRGRITTSSSRSLAQTTKGTT